MSVGYITAFIFISFLLLMATGLPVAFSMLGVSAIGFLVFVGPQALYNIFSVAFRIITTDIFIAVPLFILMASVLQVSGIGERMYDAMYKWMSGVRGGLAIGTILICTLIAAMSGLVATGTVIMGLLAYPEMRKRGYDRQVAAGSIMAGGVLGPLIPPSVPMILVGGLTSLSTGKLFMAGVIPGIICSGLFMVYIGLRCLISPELAPAIPKAERPAWGEKLRAVRGLIVPLALIVVTLGGIWRGVFTPSEAGGIGAFGSLVCAAIFRNLNYKNMKAAVTMAFKANAMVMWLAIGGASFSSLVGITGVTKFVETSLTALPLNPTGILIGMLVLVFILGMFVDTVAIVMISIPIMMPVVVKLGFDPLWFGFLFVLDVIIGMITPPFGYSIFYMKGMGYKELSMMDLYRSTIPFVGVLVVVLVLCVALPQVALWLPNTMIR